MSIAVNGMDGNPWTTRDLDASSSNVVTSYHKLAFSGNYTTAVGGDTLDLSSVAGLIPSGALPLQITYEANGLGTSQSAAGGYYQIGAGNALNNSKVKIFASGGAELGTGGYPVAVTSDVVTLVITWRKLTT
jgi:hypothetical protein